MDVQADILLAVLEDISKGYSKYELSVQQNALVYFKHLNNFELLGIRKNYNNNLELARQHGILPEKEQIQIAYENGWWSKQKDGDLESTNLSIERLKKTISKLIYESDKSRIRDQIKLQEDKAKKLKDEKSAYIVITAEEWAGRKSVDYFLQNFLYKDCDLKFKFFESEDDFEISDDILIDELTIYYYKFLMDFGDKKIKQLAISPIFQNIAYISNCTSDAIFGVPAINLTKNQSELLIFAKYYQNIIKNSDGNIPDAVYEDPDRILEWFESTKSQRDTVGGAKNKLKNKSGSDNSSSFLFGNRDEVKAIAGGEVLGDKIIHESKQRGDLGIYDLIKK